MIVYSDNNYACGTPIIIHMYILIIIMHVAVYYTPGIIHMYILIIIMHVAVYYTPSIIHMYILIIIMHVAVYYTPGIIHIVYSDECDSVLYTRHYTHVYSDNNYACGSVLYTRHYTHVCSDNVCYYTILNVGIIFPGFH